MNPYYFLYYCAFTTVRKLASKSMMDNVPDSAMYFVNGIVFLALWAILFFLGGPPLPGSFAIIKGLSLFIGIIVSNYYIFAYNKKYTKIVDYYNAKYMDRIPLIIYFVIPICYVFLMFLLGRIHDHYGAYYRMNGLK